MKMDHPEETVYGNISGNSSVGHQVPSRPHPAGPVIRRGHHQDPETHSAAAEATPTGGAGPVESLGCSGSVARGNSSDRKPVGSGSDWFMEVRRAVRLTQPIWFLRLSGDFRLLKSEPTAVILLE